MLLLLAGYAAASSPPAFDVDFDGVMIAVNDVGLHLLDADLSRRIATSTVRRMNLNETDTGWKITQVGKRWNIRKD